MGKVTEAPAGSPLKDGDRVLEFDGEPLFYGADSVKFLRAYMLRTPRTEVRLRVRRAGADTEVLFPLK